MNVDIITYLLSISEFGGPVATVNGREISIYIKICGILEIDMNRYRSLEALPRCYRP